MGLGLHDFEVEAAWAVPRQVVDLKGKSVCLGMLPRAWRRGGRRAV
jgi:hypothetical protein